MKKQTAEWALKSQVVEGGQPKLTQKDCTNQQLKKKYKICMLADRTISTLCLLHCLKLPDIWIKTLL